MTSSSIRKNLQEIRQTESDAKKSVEEAEKEKEATIETTKKKAQKLMEKAQLELRKYEDFVLERSRKEAEVVCEDLGQKADQEVATLTQIAEGNREKTVELIIKRLSSPLAKNVEQKTASAPPENH